LLSIPQKPDKKLGYVTIPVEEVARNKAMKDEWPLLDADKGDIQLRCGFWQVPSFRHSILPADLCRSISKTH